MKQLLFTAGLLLAAGEVAAQTMAGRVTDGHGRPVPKATVEVVGTNVRARTDEQGRFELNLPASEVDEVHVEAKGFSHQVFHLHGEQSDPLNITLHKTVMEQIDVIGLPIHASTMESVQAIAVLGGEELRNKQASTLGETLKYEVGVHSSYFGPVASSPIIRGLDGPRVLITQNGLDVGDASRIGPDHVVAVESATAEQIEILRGPATLFYGTGAIGGVINVVDDRVPQDNETRGAFLVGHNTVASENEASISYTSGFDSFAYHFDGFWRDGDDYEIPGYADRVVEPGHEGTPGVLENSASESQGFNLGGSWLLDRGFVGLSYGRLERLSGVPGHGHFEEEEADAVEAEEPAEENILSDLKQDRWQLLSELSLDNGFISGVNTRVGYTEYEHAEIHAEEEAVDAAAPEEHEEGTLFKSRTMQARVDLPHHEIARWHGALSLEFKRSNFEAIGAEAFTPPSQTDQLALAVVEEKHSGNFLWQMGARIESVDLTADPVVLEVHEHEEGAEGEVGLYEFDSHGFTPFSLSGGFIWDVLPAYKLGVSLSHSQRAPSAAEIFSLGPHIGARTFEVGALFEVHEEAPGVYHIDLAEEVHEEKSNNIDISLRKHRGDFGFVVNAFYNQVTDYYYQRDTGLFTEDLFGEEEAVMEGEEAHAHEANLPVFAFAQADANFYGMEAEFNWQVAKPVKLTLWGDSIRGQLDDGGNLPRIPPVRVGSQIAYQRSAWFTELSLVHYFEQDQMAAFETTTDGYTMVDAQLAYSFAAGASDLTLFLRGSNLTNEEARVHSSFLKDLAPLPGRGFSVGLRGEF